MKTTRRRFLGGLLTAATGLLVTVPRGGPLPHLFIGEGDPSELTLDFRESMKVEVTLDQNITTVNIVAPEADMTGPMPEYNVMLKQGGDGGHAISGWPKDVLWRKSEVPTFGDAPNTTRIMTLYQDEKQWFAEVSGIYT